MKSTALLLLAASALSAAAQGLTQPGLSPIVTWDLESVYGGGARPATVRPMLPAELKLSRDRAEAFFNALKAVPSFARPERHVTYLSSFAHLDRGPVLSQSYVAVWGVPRDTRKRADGAYYGIMGGALEQLFMDTNRVPFGDKPSPGNDQDFDRAIEIQGQQVALFTDPPVYGQAGGGTVYGAWFVATRDGRPALAPVPVGLLLQMDIEKHRKRAADTERGFATSLRELEASMTPAASAARRAKREAAWARETRDPAAMAKRLDAAERTDQFDYERQKARLTPPPAPDPRDPHWSAKLAAQALEQTLASLDAAGRNAPACGRVDPAFSSELSVRWHAAGPDAPAGCKPMMRWRDDLIAPGKPEEVRVFAAWLRDANCGRAWDRPPQDHVCSRINAALRELDWPAVRRSFGWKEQP